MKIKKCLNCNVRLENNTENFCIDCIDDFSNNGVKIDQDLMEITPLIEELSEKITNNVFEDLWKENKTDIKELSKKDLAILMFYNGLSEALSLSALTGMPKEYYENLIVQVNFVNFMERFSNDL